MKNGMKKIAAVLLAAALMVAPAYAYYDSGDTVAPGDTIGIPYSEFFDGKGNLIDSGVEFTDKNFAVAKKTIKRGSNLVKSIKINNRTEELEITFSDRAAEAPNSPNVIITDLAVRATKTLRDGSYTILKSGTLYKYDGDLEFRVGGSANTLDMSRDGVEINLEAGDSQYVKWVRGDSYGNVTVNYGSIATATGRVYENDKILYTYTDEVDDRILDRNDSAYIEALNIGGGTFESPLKLLILVEKDQYIYIDDNGTLRDSGAKWDKDEWGWAIKIGKGTNFIISDTKLRSSGSAPSGSVDDSYDDSSSSSSRPAIDNPYYNPDTGGGSGTVTAVAAIVAIVAIAVVAVIMSTIVTVKTGRRPGSKKDEE